MREIKLFLEAPKLGFRFMRLVQMQISTERMLKNGLISWDDYLRRKAVLHAARAAWLARLGSDSDVRKAPPLTARGYSAAGK